MRLRLLQSLRKMHFQYLNFELIFYLTVLQLLIVCLYSFKNFIKKYFFCLLMLNSNELERWPSGRRRTPGKRVFRYRGIEGSNPFLSAKKVHLVCIFFYL